MSKQLSHAHESLQNRRSNHDAHARSNNEGAAIMYTSSMATHSDVVSKTAVSTISADGRYADANILMDEGAHKSFITQKMADQLKLQRDGFDVINISPFGDPTHTVQHLDTATVYVVATAGEMIPIRVLIVPIIAKPLANRFRQSVNSLKYLRGLRLAHPVTADDTFEISLLIGADFYWQIDGD